MNKWQCSFTDENGVRCPAQAVWRIHFTKDHPFDHVDTCDKHYNEFQVISWVQDLRDYENA